jgi:hypothetical protein
MCGSARKFVAVPESLWQFVAVQSIYGKFLAVLMNRFHSSSRKFATVCDLLQVLESFKVLQVGKTFNKSFAYFKRPNEKMRK